MSARRIFVVGSLNMDLLQAVSRMPAPGETIAGSELEISPGGKGANQARAAARLGAPVVMVGKVGDDSFGQQLRAALESDHVKVGKLLQSEKATGAAIVLLLPNGENSIIIAPGANGDLQPAEVTEALSLLEAGDLLLCQLETPIETVTAALKLARNKGAISILDPAPARELPADLLRSVDILTPNEGEAAQLTPSGDIHALAELTGGGTVIIKRGSAGCVALAEGQTLTVPAFPVTAVDTTAAGDTFNGALAVALLRDYPLENALRFASAAGALCVTRKGAGNSAPTLQELEAFLERHTIMGS